MDAEEIAVFEGAHHSIIVNGQNFIKKRVAIEMRDIYNKYNENDRQTYCMCSSMKRLALVKQYLKWFEGTDR